MVLSQRFVCDLEREKDREENYLTVVLETVEFLKCYIPYVQNFFLLSTDIGR